MNDARRFQLTAKILIGGSLVLLGVLFLLDNFGLIDAASLWHYWPLVLVVVGAVRMVRPRRSGERLWGCIEVAVGVLLLLRYFDVIQISLFRLWPGTLVLLGIYLIWQAAGRRAEAPGTPAADDPIRVGLGARFARTRGLGGSNPDPRVLDGFTLFGGGNRVVRTPDFRGGTVTTIFGSFEIDLTDAVIAGDSASIEFLVIFGGVELRVPDGWNVVVNATPIIGGVEYKPRPGRLGETASKTLMVTGLVVFGGIEIKN